DGAAFAGTEYLRGGGRTSALWPDGDPATRVPALRDTVGAGYFKTLGIPFLVGRDFGPDDRAGAPRAAIVNEALARRLFGAGRPSARRVRREAVPVDGELTYEVVGVVANTKFRSLREPFQPILFVPSSQDPQSGALVLLAVSSRLPPAQLSAGVVRAALAVAP